MLSHTYLTENKNRHLADAAQLSADGREDDAILARIRANIFDIFLQAGVLGVAEQTKKILAHLQTKWEEDLTLAEQHGDTAAAAVAHIQLAVLHEITHSAESEVQAHG